MHSTAGVADRCLLEIDRALEHTASGTGRAVVISGPAGIGKSTLLGDAARGARSYELVVAATRARDEHRTRPAATIRATVAELEGGQPSTVPDSELVDRLLSVEPLALLIDDAHKSDELTLRLLAELAEQIDARPVLLAIAFREHLLDEGRQRLIDSLSGLEHGLMLTVLPLDRARADDMIRAVIPEATPDFCAACAELTGSNPFLLKELVTWISAHGLEPTADAPSRSLQPVPPRAMRRFFRSQLEQLGPEPAAIASAIAFSERPPGLEDAARIAGMDIGRCAQAVDALLESCLIAPAEPLAFVAPIAAPCVRAATVPAAATDLRRRVAASPPDHDLGLDATAQRILLAPPAGDQRIVEQLVELAEHEATEGNIEEAEALLRRALTEGISDPALKAHLLVRLGHLLLLRGSGASTAPLAAGVADLDGHERADGLLKLGIAELEAGSPRDAALVFERVTDLIPADNSLRTRAEVRGTLADLLVPEKRQRAHARIGSLLSSRDQLSPQDQAELMLANAWLGVCEARPHTGIVETVGQALADHQDDGAPLGGYFETVASTVLALADDFEAADQVGETATQAARAAGSVLAQRNLQLAQAVALFHSDRLEEAAARCNQVLVPEGDQTGPARAAAAALLAVTLLERDRPAEALAVIDEAEKTDPHELPQLLMLEVRARLALSREAIGAALKAAQESEHLALSLGILNPAVVAWQPIAAVCYQRSGELRRAHALADEAIEAAERFGTPRALGVSLRAKAWVAGPPDDLAHLELAHSITESSPASLERAKVLIDYGAALHRAGRDTAARGCLRSGIELADRAGAWRSSRRGLAALVAAGGRPRRHRLVGPESLTPAERRVVDLASSGATNREIAETLVVSHKTVEWHLRKAFVKLGAGSRDELANAMRTG